MGKFWVFFFGLLLLWSTFFVGVSALKAKRGGRKVTNNQKLSGERAWKGDWQNPE